MNLKTKEPRLAVLFYVAIHTLNKLFVDNPLETNHHLQVSTQQDTPHLDAFSYENSLGFPIIFNGSNF